jgi:hypothetical protein
MMRAPPAAAARTRAVARSMFPARFQLQAICVAATETLLMIDLPGADPH